MGGGRDFGDFNCGPRTARPRGGTCSRVTYRPFCTSPPTHPLTLKLMGDPVRRIVSYHKAGRDVKLRTAVRPMCEARDCSSQDHARSQFEYMQSVWWRRTRDRLFRD